MELDQSDNSSSVDTQTRLCLRYFDQLRVMLETSDPPKPGGISYSTACDELGRFRIWAGNVGALQHGRSQSYLDSRLREDPKIFDQVVDLLEDLSESLEEEAHLTALVCMIVSGKRRNRTSLPPENSENYSTQDGSRVRENVVSGEVVPTSEVQELFESAAETITSLFKLSILIRNATSRDRYARAMLAAKEPLDDSFDISHVGHKFPHIHEPPWLEQRLGKAITQRRQYLMYCRENRSRLAEDKEYHEDYQLLSQDEKPLRMLKSQTQQPNKAHEPDSENKIPSTINLTAASTLAPSVLDKPDDISDQNRSLTSYATSLGNDSSMSELKVPPMPEKAASGMPFECPYCWGIQTLRDERSWRLATQSCRV
ncbi:hypothetical protein MMC07_003063 [Pseudocyphellaria aurata]|nr:hypothetical protein [Pseudocyphellaria aurata]